MIKKEYTMSEIYLQAGEGPESESWTTVLGIWAEETGSRGESGKFLKSVLTGKATRLLHPWNFLSKSTGVGCHSFSRGSSQPRVKPGSPALQADALLSEPPGNRYKKSHD